MTHLMTVNCNSTEPFLTLAADDKRHGSVLLASYSCTLHSSVAIQSQSDTKERGRIPNTVATKMERRMGSVNGGLPRRHRCGTGWMILHAVAAVGLCVPQTTTNRAQAFAFGTQRRGRRLHNLLLRPTTRLHFVSPKRDEDGSKDNTAKTPLTIAELSSRREPLAKFDPFELPPPSTETVHLARHVEGKKDEQQKQHDAELGIWTARGLLLLVAAIWGTNFASVKYLENLCFDPPCHHPPSEAALARFGLAALVSLPLLYKQSWGVIKAGLECGLWIALGYASQAMALSTIDSGKCAFICSLTVVFVPVMSALVYGKPMKVTNIMAALVALAGVGVLEGLLDVNALLLHVPPAMAAGIAETTTLASSGAAMEAVSSTITTSASAVTEASTTGPLATIAESLGVSKGDILALGQPIGFGTAFTRIEKYQEELKDVPNRILTIAAAQCVAVGLCALGWVLYDFHGVVPSMSYMIEPHRLAAIFWTGIVTTVVAIYIEGVALQKATATDASLAFSTEPVWASLFGFMLLHETIGSESYIGGSIILMACVIGAVSDLMSAKSDGQGTK